MNRREWRRTLPAPGLMILFAMVLVGASCRSAPSPPAATTDAVSLRLDAVPLLLKADSSSAAVIWATVTVAGDPIADSTTVVFVASQGTITPEALTKDGLAQATFKTGTATGLVSIVGQVKAVRDTVQLTVY